jgi:hypothetical protein
MKETKQWWRVSGSTAVLAVLALCGIAFTYFHGREPGGGSVADGLKKEPRAQWEYKTVEVKPYEDTSEEVSISIARLDKLTGSPTKWHGSNLLFIKEPELNNLGADGWELVSAVPEVETVFPLKDGFIACNTRTERIVLLFKRAKLKWN